MGIADGEPSADHHAPSNALNLRMKQIEQFVEEGAVVELGVEDRTRTTASETESANARLSNRASFIRRVGSSSTGAVNARSCSNTSRMS
jgi:hypothetical protein